MSKKLLTLGSLATLAIALPGSQRPLGDDEDNDTPLPLIIWHGELDFLPGLAPTRSAFLTIFSSQVSEIPTEMKASSPLPLSPKPFTPALSFTSLPKAPIPTPTNARPSGATSMLRLTSSARTSPQIPSSLQHQPSMRLASARVVSSSAAGSSVAKAPLSDPL